MGDQLLGAMAWIIPVLVAVSAFGALSVHIMTSSRMCFVGARDGHFPMMLSHISVNRFTPTPALVFLVWMIGIQLPIKELFLNLLCDITFQRFNVPFIYSFQCILSLVMLCTSDVFVLITYCSFVESFFIMLSVSGVLWLRYKRPKMIRPIKVNHKFTNQLINYFRFQGIFHKNFSFILQVSLWVPISFVLICIMLVIIPFYERPYETIIGALITASGIPAYYLGIVCKNRPTWLQNINRKCLFPIFSSSLHNNILSLNISFIFSCS